MRLQTKSRRLVTPPVGEPLTVKLAKLHCIVFHTKDDLLFPIWISTARQKAEELSGKCCLTQQWEFGFSSFPALTESLYIPGRPLQSVDSITYIDEFGVEQDYGTLSGSPAVIEEYELIQDNEAPRIQLKYGKEWPTVAPNMDVAVKVLCTLGYEDDAEAFAANTQAQHIRSGMLLLVAHFNENREAVVITEGRSDAIEIPLGIKSLLYNPKVG